MTNRVSGLNVLTYTEVAAAKPKEKDYSLGDGGGLLLYIKASGAKIWRFRYTHPLTKKRQTLTIGRFPNITLADARSIRNESSRMVSLGVDPIDERDKQMAMRLLEKSMTFEKVYQQWIVLKRSQKLREKSINDMVKRFRGHLLPLFGKMPVNEITPRVAISAFQKLIEREKLQMLKLCVFDLNSVMNYAVNSGLIEANPVIKIWAALPKPTVQNRPTMRPEELPELMEIVKNGGGEPFIKLLFEWQLLTMVRPSEASNARWSEIDFDTATWKIPPERMKGNREHIVPLSKQAMKILERLNECRRGDIIFYSAKYNNEALNASSVAAFLRRTEQLKGRIVPHGLRALASTTLNELGFSPDVIEAALAHKSGDVMRDTYNRSNYFEQRRIMMSHWGDLVDKAKNGEAIIMDGNRGLRAVGM
ncbi:tyrosine-type recombinase/integrase [Providencia rettgeri]